MVLCARAHQHMSKRLPVQDVATGLSDCTVPSPLTGDNDEDKDNFYNHGTLIVMAIIAINMP